MTKQEFDEAYNNGYQHGYAAGRSDGDSGVLDKIREEMKHHSEHFIDDNGEDCFAIYEDDVLAIIDKCREAEE